MRKSHKYENRRYVISGVVAGVVLVFILKLVFIQIINPSYKSMADSNALLVRTVYPMRGVMYDRRGEIVVNNQVSYNVTVVMREVVDLDTLSLCSVLGITREFFDRRMSEIKDIRRNLGYSSYTPQVFMSQLTIEEVSRFRETLYRFEGFYLNRRTSRLYPHGAAALLLGDIGEVSRSDLERDDYYVQGDFIGKQGVEKQYETYLRGVKGREYLLKDARGRVQGAYNSGVDDVQAEPGRNLTLGLDIKLQELGERLMQHKIGSIVAIEPSTGEVLCMVSAPSFSPDQLMGRMRSENFAALSEEWSKPLLNRTIQGTYPPGSTFKTAQALVQLQEGIIDTRTMLNCNRGFVYKNLRMGCHAHAAPLALYDAIATSCNGYFGWSFYRMIESDKYESRSQALTVWKDYMVKMGFGYQLGVDLPGEARGMIPNAAYYDKLYKKSWKALTIISNSIGQGEVTLTPLQIANLGATIANRGYFITPHVVKAIEGGEMDEKYSVRNYTGIDSRHYEDVVEGMRQSVLHGTCASINTPLYEICGKTGTAENHGKDHSVFMGFAPRENPQIAIAVYVENGGFGATYGVPVGALMMEQYITGTLSKESQAKAQAFSERKIVYDGEVR